MDLYNNYVKRAKFLLETIEAYQAEIAYMALKVCEIKHGGRSLNAYTMTKFAKDIGINKKTLSGWVSIYKNVISKVNIDHNKITKKDWQTALIVDDLIRQEIRLNNTLKGTQRKKNQIKNYSDERIKDLFGKYYKGKDFQHDVFNFIKYLIFMKNSLKSKDLNQVSMSSKLQMKELFDQCSDVLLDHLTPKKEVKNETRTKTVAKIPGVNGIQKRQNI